MAVIPYGCIVGRSFADQAVVAEGFAMGMCGIARAAIVGTPTMRLGAGVFPLHLDRTGTELRYSAEPVHDVQDGARSLLEPDMSAPLPTPFLPPA